jgi:hypothetical protein
MTNKSINRIFSFALLTAVLLVLAACGVTEEPGNQGSIESVVVTPPAATISIGSTQQLAAEVSGTGDFSEAVTWSSSNNAIATVNSSGLVTGQAAGTATITAASSQTASVTGTSTITVVAQAAVACTDPNSVVTFADAQVEAAVRELYGLEATGEIHCADVQQDIPSSKDDDGQELVNVLYLSRCGDGDDVADSIQSLEGLQNLTGLLRLELACNGLTDIGPLSGMTSLEELNLDLNDVSDLTPLAALTNLQVLGFYDNEVENLAPLSGLTGLRILYASNNRIHSVAPLAGLTALEQLWLVDNCRGEDDTDCLTDLGPLADLENLEALLINGNQVASLAAVAGLTRLQFLDASGNDIEDLGPLGNLDNLRTVLLDMNPISSLEALAANTEFPNQPPYGFHRGAVNLPLNGDDTYAFNLQLGFNCLDLTSTDVQAQLDELADRGAIVEGAGFMQLENEACLTGSSIQPFRAWWN